MTCKSLNNFLKFFYFLGEYSIPGPTNLPSWRPTLSDTVVENLAHSVDKLRGFGPRKLTEQELARWRQLVRGDVVLQARIVDARSIGELKSLTDSADYRLVFTRTKWNQIMECLGEFLHLPDVVDSSNTTMVNPAMNLRFNLFKNSSNNGSSGRETLELQKTAMNLKKNMV